MDFLDAMNRVASHHHGDKASKDKAMSTTYLLDLPELAPVRRSALNEQDYYADRVTDGTYQSAFLTTSDRVVSLDAPSTGGTK